MHDPRPGARLTRAERHYHRARNLCDQTQSHYQEVEDRWMRENMDRVETAGVGWKRLLRDEQRGDDLMGQSYRLWQKSRRWTRLWYMLMKQTERAYKEHRDMGFGG